MSTAKKLQSAMANAGGDALYVDDVFSTYLYEGNGSTQTITNGIDLDGEGGLVWIKNRGAGSTDHRLLDTERGIYKNLFSNLTDAEDTSTSSLTAFNSDGFTLSGFNADINDTSNTYASWTFRKAPKFFDVVTYTGDGTSNRQISHNLGTTVGMMVIKATSTTGSWVVYHKDLYTSGSYANIIELQATFGKNGYYQSEFFGGSGDVTSTYFTVNDQSLYPDLRINQSGVEYVAYLFAHNDGDGEFGTDGDQDIIKCGSFNSSGGHYNLGFEPQFLLFKRTDGSEDWHLFDTMRGLGTADGSQARLEPNTSDSESSAGHAIGITSTGINCTSGVSKNYIYIAIRRPHKPAESGDEVFKTRLVNGPSNPYSVSTNFDVDFVMQGFRTGTNEKIMMSRLLGGYINNAASKTPSSFFSTYGYMDKSRGLYGSTTQSYDYAFQCFKRAPLFLDEVHYTGNGVTTGRNIPHNLGSTPAFVIYLWHGSDTYAYHQGRGASNVLTFSSNFKESSRTDFFDAPTDTNLVVKEFMNQASNNYTAWLFGEVDGISKVGTYFGNGSSQTIDCGFGAGARFVLIKRTDSGSNQGDENSNWYMYDSTRGIVSGNDPYTAFNTAARESSLTNGAYNTDPTDSVDPASSGFIVNQDATLDLNLSGATYIYLAIA